MKLIRPRPSLTAMLPVIAVSLSIAASSAGQEALGTPLPVTEIAATPAGCCGQRMALIGRAYLYEAPDGKTPDGTPVPETLRTQAYGEKLTASAILPPGTYTVEVIASENNFRKAGQRIFNIELVTGARPTTGPATSTQQGTKIDLAKNVDLFKLAGGAAKPYTVKASVKHSGGPLDVVFTSTLDNAQFSAIRIFDAQGNRVAWLFAHDLLQLLKEPEAPPLVSGPIIWRDATQPIEKRVHDLVRRMTLSEKAHQLTNKAPAIERLGLPSYNYWSEGLHGVARNGYATVFPQAIGLSATFDPVTMHTVADAIATEARAKYNAWQAQGGIDLYGAYFRGLTFWSPNINIFRDPRWGRGQETYGEDPYLTGTMGVAFIRGLQGDDPKYFKVVATAKHFAVHSGPELLRHTYNAAPPIRDFYETYLPHFEMAVREGKVYSVMGAYNRVYGAPACDSDLLLKTLLRGQWGFQGYVVSDCGAISDIWAHHEVEEDSAAASAAAVIAGCDLECGGDYLGLPLAVDLHEIGEGAIDQSLERVLLSRFKLGLFDPPEKVPYASIKAEDNMSAANRLLALKMARESITLLKNDGILPLQHSARKIAVVGPNADGLLPLLGNYNGTAWMPTTVIQGIQDTYHGQLVYIRGCDNAAREGDWQIVPDICLRPAGARDPAETGFRAEFFENEDLKGRPAVVRTEKCIDFAHSLIQDSLANVPILQASIRWSGEFVAPADGEYRLNLSGATGYRLIINGKVIQDEWGGALAAGAGDDAGKASTAPAETNPATLPAGPIAMKLKAGQAVPIVIECHQANGYLDLQLMWNRSDMDLTGQVAQRVKDADVIIFAGGLDGRMEAEENDVRGMFKGFVGGDRETIELPAVQTALLKSLAATGKPVILVNMTGSAVAIPWEAEHLHAIIQAWYPGQAGGRAIADVLFGDYNPAGRLPVTFYSATSDLPAFTDYAMKGRTYRYYTGKPLWSFGHGLSYTTFRYTGMQAGKNELSAGDTVKVGIDIANTGQRDGDEVVQLYAKPVKPGPGDALEHLVAFQRVFVRAGQSAHVELTVAIQSLRNWDIQKNAYAVPPGDYSLMMGASSADIRATQQITVK